MPGVLIAQPPPAPRVIGPSTKSITRPKEPLPEHLLNEARLTRREEFDAAKHLNFRSPTSVITMKDIGLEGHGISPIAVSEPFPLFTEEAIQQMRAEVFSDDVVRDCQFASNFNKNMIRCMGPVRAPFIHAAWRCPELLDVISKVAGVDLVPVMDVEIAQINISVGNSTVKEPAPKEDDPLGDGLSSVAWHYDSYPFVCVVMLSDCSGMVGGETALKTASGEIRKVRGPAMGTAVVMQGRYIEHQGLKAFGGRERISMVTSFRPKCPLVMEESVLTGVRAISYKEELYSQYTEYRLEILEERIRAKLKQERAREQAKRPFDASNARFWLIQQKNFIEAMLDEVTDE